MTIDNCKKAGVVMEDVVATVEVIRCNGLQLQTTGSFPSLSIDNTDGASVFLSAAAVKEVSIYTAKSNAINIMTPGEGEDADMNEAPIPEQFVSTFVNGKLVSKAVEHIGV